MLNRFVSRKRENTPPSRAVLDETLLALCFAFLEPKDILLRVARVSRQFRDVASSDLLWGTLFLRTFGHDYWGENVGRHPYVVCHLPHNLFFVTGQISGLISPHSMRITTSGCMCRMFSLSS